ncbi:MAG: nuclear transport factor 2 family protein [Gammaproteobacteria bacterium]
MSISKFYDRGLVIGVLLAATCATAQAQSVTAEDKAAIQELTAGYMKALSGCKAEEFADLFVPDTGSFASSFRGRMVGREKLILLVQSERHCTGEQPARPGGSNPPSVVVEATKSGAHGVVSLGAAEYEDEYTKTPKGWRIASRTVVGGAEKTAGLDAREMLAIQKLAGMRATDFYQPDPKGVSRLLTSGVRIAAKDGVVTGTVFLKDGSHDDEVYEKSGPGQWRVKSSTHVAAAASSSHVDP